MLQPDDGRFDTSSILDTTVFSHSLLYLASPLIECGHEVSVELATAGNVDSILREHSPDVVGLTCVTPKYPAAREILLKIKELAPEVKTVVGGHHATFLTEEVLRETRADYVVRGEGEEVFPKLVDAVAAGRVPRLNGVAHLKAGKLVAADSLARIKDLDALSLPAFDLIPKKYRSRKQRVVSSRGCPFKCDFCSVSEFHGGLWRARSVGGILDEVELLLGQGYRMIEFVDDNFTLDFRRVVDFCVGVRERGLDFSWGIQARVDDLHRNPALIGLLADAGCYRVSLGVESGVQGVLDSYGKGITVGQAEEVSGWLRGSSMLGYWYFILGSGNQHDCHNIIEKSMTFMESFDFDVAQVSILTPFPGTALYRRLEAEGRLLHKDWSLYDGSHCVYRPQGMTSRQMEEKFIEAYKRLYLTKGPLELARRMRKAHKTGFMEHKSLTKVAELLARACLLGEDWNRIQQG